MRPLSASLVLLFCLFAAPGPASPREAPRRIPGAEKVQVNLVLIDVVVRDRKDRPLSGLQRGDFKLLVDRKPVDPADIETFEEICPAPAGGASIPPGAAASIGIPPAPAQVEPAALRHIVLYLDFSQMTLDGRRQSLKAARAHIASQVGPSDRVMILAFKRSLRLVQDFTSDAALLASRIDEMVDDTSTVDSDVLDERHQMKDVASKPCDVTGSTCIARSELAATYAHMEQVRAFRSLAAIEGLMPALAGIRGRKAFILFTDVLRDEPGVQYLAIARSTPGQVGITIKESLLRLTREANAAGVSLYTVHASGLDDVLTSEFRDARPDNVSFTTSTTSSGTFLSISSTGADHAQNYQAAAAGLDSALALQTTLATETGGKALQRTNDLGAILATAQQDLSCYYLIGYRYDGVGDGARHSLLVEVGAGPGGESRRGLTIRHRPYYTDTSPVDRQERLLKSALQAPDLYRSFPITTEAFALAPEDSRRRILIKTTVPLDSLTLTPSGPTELTGRVLVTGEVHEARDARDPVCAFHHEVPFSVARRPDAASRLIFETGCVLDPGTYEMALAVLDPATREVGARRTPLSVPSSGSSGRQAFVSDVYLWARDDRAILVSAGAEKVGLKDRASTTAFVPRSERRLARGEPATLSFLFCPAEGSIPTPGSPVRVRRALMGDGDATVSDFDDLLLSAPPDVATGCYQIVNAIPPNTLGDGVYRFTIRLSGATLGEPVVREAALAVD